MYSIVWSIAPGKTDEFKRLVEEAIAVARDKSGVRTYEWYFSEDGSRCGLIEVYPDGSALVPHLTAVGNVLNRMLGISKITRFDVFGNLDDGARSHIDRLGARLYSPFDGFRKG